MKLETSILVLCSLALFTISNAQNHVFGTTPSDGPVNSVPSVEQQQKRSRKSKTKDDNSNKTPATSSTEPKNMEATTIANPVPIDNSFLSDEECFDATFDCVPRSSIHKTSWDRNCAIGSQQVKMTIIEHPGDNNVAFRFSVAGRQLMVINRVSFEDSHLLLDTLLEDEIAKKGKVRFRVDKNAKSLNNFADKETNFIPRFSLSKRIEGSEKAREVSANGIKQGNKEYLYIPFKISDSYTKEQVETAIRKGQIRVAITASEFTTTSAASLVSENVNLVPETEQDVYFMSCPNVNYHFDLN